MAKVTVKNTARGPRGIRTQGGDLVMIEAGRSASGDFSDQEVKDFKAALKAEAGPAPANEPDADDGDDAEGGGSGEGGDPALAGSINDLKARIADFDDADELDRLIEAEKAGANRSGAIGALEAKRDELKGA